MKALLGVLRNRNLGLLLSGRVVSTGGDWLYQVALSVAIFQFSHGNSFDVGLLWIVRLIPALLLGPVGGMFADRLGYRKAMIAADIGRMSLVILLALILHPATWVLIYPVAFAVTALGSLFRPASVGIIPSLVNSRDERLTANAATMQAESLASIVGSAVGGVVAGMGLINTLLFIDAATFAVSAAALWAIRPHAVQPAPVAIEEEGPIEEKGRGFTGAIRMLGRRPLLVFAVSTMAMPEIASGALMVWIVPYAEQTLRLGNEGVGYLYSVLGIGAFVGGLVAAAVAGSIRLEKLLAISVAIGGASLALLGAAHITVLALGFVLVYGLSETVEYASYETLLQQAVPEDSIGQASGTVDSFLFNMMLVGTLVAGLLAGAVGLSAAIVAVGCLVVLGTVGAWWNLQRKTAGQPDAAALARIPAFAGVSPTVREWAVRRMVREAFPVGATVIRQGDTGDRFYTIARGRAEVEIAGETVRRELGPGDFFGEIALLHDFPRTATVRATQPLTLWTMSREDFEELQSRASHFKDSLWETASARMETSPDIKMALATRI